jgi:hypothetical protein
MTTRRRRLAGAGLTSGKITATGTPSLAQARTIAGEGGDVPATTRDTVASLTPAARAMSACVGRGYGSS